MASDRTFVATALGLLAVVVAVVGTAVGVSMGAFSSTTDSGSISLGADTLLPPTNLQVDDMSVSAYSLSWDPTPSTYAAGYEVYRSATQGSGFTLLTTLPGRLTLSYDDTSPLAGASYYRLEAYYENWTSVPSGEAGGGFVDVRVTAANDDAEEAVSTGAIDLTSTDLELVREGGSNLQYVGMRFDGMAVPSGATVTKAWIQFQVDETSSEATSLTFRAQASDDAGAFTAADFDISGRSVTSASVAWSPAPWGTVGDAGPDQQTPDLAAVVQEVISRPGWASGNAIVIRVDGTGQRIAEAYDGEASAAPLLHIEFTP